MLTDKTGKIFLFLGGCIIGLLLCEATVRALHLYPPAANMSQWFRFVDNPNIVYELMPGKEWDGCYINKGGFRRDTEFQKEKPAGVVRIAMLGDSITEGIFVRQGKTFSDILESILNEHATSQGHSNRYEVMNCGVAGYNLTAEVEVLKVKILQYRPDIVVLNMFHNDNDPIPNLHGFFINSSDLKQQLYIVRRRYDNLSSPSGALRETLAHSKLWSLLKYGLWSINNGKASVASIKEHYTDDDWDLENIYAGFSELQRLRSQYGFKILVCIHSHLLFGEHPNNQRFEKIARKYGFPCFRMMRNYLKSGVSPESIRIKNNPNDGCHPNESGHAIIAQAMFEELKKNHLINLQ